MKKLIFVIMVFLLPITCYAETNEETAISYAKIVRDQYFSFGVFTATGKLITTKNDKNVSGNIGVYLISTAKHKDGLYIGNATLLAVTSPAGLNRTQLVTTTDVDKDYSQFYYDEDTPRAKRVSSHGNSVFVGSEFSYSEIGRLEVNHFKDYKYIGPRACGDLVCHVVKRKPNFNGANYASQEVWFVETSPNKGRCGGTGCRIDHIIFQNKSGKIYKTLTFKNYRLFQEKFWRPMQMVMKNHKRKKTSTITWDEWQFTNNSDFVSKRLYSHKMPFAVPMHIR